MIHKFKTTDGLYGAIEISGSDLIVDFKTPGGRVIEQQTFSGAAGSGMLTEPPTNPDDPGVAGQTAYDADYFYICVSTNLWKRAALSTITPPMHVNLISHWKHDETSGTRYDSHGTNHLTDNATVTSTTGKIGNASQFTAANSESLSIASNATLPTGAASFTLTGWFQVTTFSSYHMIWARDGWNMYLEPSTPTFRFGNSSSPPAGINASAILTVNTWAFFAAWWDVGAATANAQLNNGTVNSAAHSISGTAATMYLGRRGDGFYMNGLMDSCSMWSRVLTTDERTALYNGGAGLDYPF